KFYEDDLLGFLAHIDLSGLDIVDVGANIGNHTVNFGLSHEDSRIISVEPFGANLKILRTNISDNGLSRRVDVIEAAAGDETGDLALSNIDSSNFGAVTVAKVEPGGTDEMVHQVRLDQLNEIGAAGLLKIDVEGFESNVISGATELIAEFRPIIVTEAHTASSYRSISSLLAAHDYVPIAILGRSDNFIWASIGKTLSQSKFIQITKLAEILGARDFRKHVLRRLARIDNEVNDMKGSF